MCGIAGVRKFGETPITGEEIVILLCSLEHRGQHATGIALENPDGIHVLKSPQPAWQFTMSGEFQEFLKTYLTEDTSTALLHTRWATTGNPEDNNNNHPIFDGATAITHNGMIHNHDFLFTQGKYDKSCETDSDIVRAIVSAHGLQEKGIRELCKMTGSAAIACISTKYPGKLLLARSGSPLVFGFTEDGDKLYWASEPQAISKASRPYKIIRGIQVQDKKINMSIGSMPDDTAWVFGPEEIEFHHKFDTCSHYRQPDYSKGRSSYHGKKKSWKRDLRRAARIAAAAEHARIVPVFPNLPLRRTGNNKPGDVVVVGPVEKGSITKCPGCGHPVSNDTGAPWKELACSNCSASLGE